MPKSPDLNLTSPAYKHVFRLDVTVNDAEVMNVLKARSDLSHVRNNPGQRNCYTKAVTLPQVAIRRIIHSNVRATVLDIIIEDTHYIWMRRQLSDCLRFVFEKLGLFVDQVFMKYFHSNLGMEPNVFAQVYFAKAPTSQSVKEIIRSKPSSSTVRCP